MPDFLTRLKQRKLVQWAVTYLATGWALLQVLQLLSATYDWSPTLMRFLPIGIAVGFLLVVVLAWYHGEIGQQRASSTEVAILAVVLLGGAAVAWLVARSGGQVAPVDAITGRDKQGVIRLAVLPFESIGRAEDAYVADAISNEIRGKLSGVAGLEVIARGSSNAYRQTTKQAHEIASELRVQYLLTGTVRSQPASGGQPARIRVSPELVQVSTANTAPVTRWQEPFDAELTDIFEVQTDIARRVAAGMDIALGASDRARLAERPTSNPAAYEAFLQANNAAGESFKDLDDAGPYQEAVTHLERAVQLDPDFARAWGQMATYSALAQWFTDRGNTNAEYGRRSRAASENAMRLSPDREGPIARGNYFLFAKGDFKAAADVFERALRDAPHDSGLLTGLCTSEEFLDRWTEAADHCQRALSINPRNFDAHQRAAVSLAATRNTKAALALSVKTRELALASGDDGTVVTSTVLAIRIRVYAGDVDSVRAILQRALEDGADGERVLINAFSHAFWLYEPAQLRRLLTIRELGNPDNTRHIPAVTHYLLGDTAAARRAAAAARVLIEQRLRTITPGSPTEAGRRMHLAVTLLIEGRVRDAIREGERAARVMPLDTDGINAPDLHRRLAWIHLMAGDTARALDVLAPILEKPRIVTPAAIRTDPRFAALRGNPRFDRLVTGQ